MTRLDREYLKGYRDGLAQARAMINTLVRKLARIELSSSSGSINHRLAIQDAHEWAKAQRKAEHKKW